MHRRKQVLLGLDAEVLVQDTLCLDSVVVDGCAGGTAEQSFASQ